MPIPESTHSGRTAMTDLTLASDPADAQAVEAVANHHAQLAGELTLLVADLAGAAETESATAARDRLLTWARESLVPHAEAEEKSLYPAARELPQCKLLIDAMLAEHESIVRTVEELANASKPVGQAAAGRALKALFDIHLEHENDQVLPALAASPAHSVAALLEGMHEVLGGHEHTGEPDGHDGSCTCGHVDPPGFPELDVRVIPHAVRHSMIFGALDALKPDGGLVLIADHDPVPLLMQLEQRAPGAFRIDYLERGPAEFRLEVTRA